MKIYIYFLLIILYNYRNNKKIIKKKNDTPSSSLYYTCLVSVSGSVVKNILVIYYTNYTTAVTILEDCLLV